MKRVICLVLVLGLVCLPLLAVSQSADELRTAVERLTDDELLALCAAVEDEIAARGLTAMKRSAPAQKDEALVWVTKSGKRYHIRSTCSNMGDPAQITLEQAVELGYTPCKKCHPPEK